MGSNRSVYLPMPVLRLRQREFVLAYNQYGHLPGTPLPFAR